MGDAFYLTFDDPVEAVCCAVDIQRRLAAAPIETPEGLCGCASEFIPAFLNTLKGSGTARTWTPPRRSKPWRRNIRLFCRRRSMIAGAAYLTRRDAKREKSDFTFLGKPRKSAAVLGFKNLGKTDEEWLGNALPELLQDPHVTVLFCSEY